MDTNSPVAYRIRKNIQLHIIYTANQRRSVIHDLHYIVISFQNQTLMLLP